MADQKADKKRKRQPAGDRDFIDSLTTDTTDNQGYAPSDVDGFVVKADEDGEARYYPEDQAEYDQDTGRDEGMTRAEAIRVLAKSEGIQNPSGDLEELLQQIKEKRKKKAPSVYESPVPRAGI